MSGSGRRLRAVVSRLSYANVMATLAVFMVLGGGAYAAAALPRNSVGAKQIRRDAVTRSKLADRSVGTAQLGRRSVTTNRLSRGVQRALRRAGTPGPAGPRGLTGATGPRGSTGERGPAGPGARRINFSAEAEANPTPTTVLDLSGLVIVVACVQTGADVAMPITGTSADTATFNPTFTADNGTDLSQPNPTFTGNIQFSMPAGTPTSLGGPVGVAPEFNRAHSTVAYVSASATLTLDVVAIADPAAGRCTFAGTAVPST